MSSDPRRSIPKFLRQLIDVGFVGVQNFPTVGLIDRDSLYRQNLEETGMGYDKEIAMIAEAVRLGLLTTPYVFDEDDAEQMARVGADIVVGGSLRIHTLASSHTYQPSSHGVNDERIHRCTIVEVSR